MISQRLPSIDIFRGLTMLLMIFVNELAGVHGLPWWNYHLHADQNGMTYVDMVFPAFLFIVGLSLPLAIDARVRKGSTPRQLWLHIFSRSAGLLALGIALANAGKCTSMRPSLWGFLVLLSGILFWMTNRRFKYVGLAGLVILFALFRRAGSQWLDFSYWEILGIIGFTYLAVCLLYVPTRQWKFAPAIWLVASCCYNAVAPSHGYGAFCGLVFAGIVCLQLRHKPLLGLAYAAILFATGLALMPLGISKIRATPTWWLFTAAAATLIFLLLHYLCDVKEKTRWASFVKPAGSNTILTYLLPDLYFFGIGGISWFNQGLLGAFKAAVFTGMILAISALLTKAGIRMQL